MSICSLTGGAPLGAQFNWVAFLAGFLPMGVLGFGAGFAENGAILTQWSEAESAPYAGAIHPDGSFYLVGYGGSTSTADTFFAASRYLPSGALDVTFGEEGVFRFDFGKEEDLASSLLVEPDGRIVLGGWATNRDLRRFALIRLLPDGSLDPSFGNVGTVDMALSAGISEARIHSLARQSDGKYIAVGRFFAQQGTTDIAVVRYQADGHLDPTFAEGGIAVIDLFGGQEIPSRVVIQEDGKIMVAGSRFLDFSGEATLNAQAFLLRLLPDGSRDATFGTDGVVLHSDLAFLSPEQFSFFAASNGDWLLATPILREGRYAAGIRRLSPDGSVRADFGDDGMVLALWDVGMLFFGTLVELNGGDLLFGGGVTNSSNGTELGVERFTADGQRVTSFGENGLARGTFNASYGVTSLGTVLLPRPNGDFIFAGREIGNMWAVGAVRFDARGQVDSGAPGLTFEEWMATNYPFLTGADALPTADPDGDGLSNLHEFAFGGNPSDPAFTPIPPVEWNGDRLRVQFLRAQREAVYTVQGSEDLISWTDLSVPISSVGGLAQYEEATAGSAGTPRFLRVQVELLGATTTE